MAEAGEMGTPRDWPPDGGAMGAAIRAHDWVETPLGPVATWPPSLRAAVDLILPAPFPAVVLWGPGLIQLYNDGYHRLMGAKHPAGLGQPTRDCWPEAWPINAPIYARVWRGEAVTREGVNYPIDRRGALEEARSTLAYSPLRDDDGAIGGVLVTVVETTARLLAGRGHQATEVALREREEAQAFLLRLADALRPLANAAAIEGETCRLLGEHLGADRVYYVELREAEGVTVVQRDYARGDVPSLRGTYPVAAFAWTLALYRRGDPVVIADVWSAATIPDADRPAAADAHVAWIAIPLVRDGALVGALCVADMRPRAWTDAEVTLARETADRLWATIERGRAEEALAVSEARFRGFAEASANTLWIVDAATGHLAFLSPSFARMFGTTRERAFGEPGHWDALVHPDDRAAFATVMTRALAGETGHAEYRIARPDDGATRWIRDTAFPIRDAAGAVAYAAGIAQDVTADHQHAADRERLYTAEREARALAEATVRGRDEFLATAAHELRAPLARLRLGSQLLQLGDALPPAERPETLASIERASVRLEVLARDLVDLARLRTGQFALAFGPVDLGAVAREAVDEARARAAADGRRVELDLPAALPPVVADAGRLAQVLANLLDNAMQASPPRTRITVALRREGDGVALAVRDEGQGLAPGEAEAIFAPFARSAQAVAREQQGLGLGLAICQGIVAQHGGWIRAASPGEGRGTTVTVWLPVAGPPGAAPDDE